MTVSTSRFAGKSKGKRIDDGSGDIAESSIKKTKHHLVSKDIVDDEVEMIRALLLKNLYEKEADVVFLLGGTGIAKRDVTLEAVRPLLDKELDGFGEVFRFLSYQEIGSAAILSRALGGCIDGRLIFCLPGSPNAVKTGLQIVLPELSHAISIARS